MSKRKEKKAQKLAAKQAARSPVDRLENGTISSSIMSGFNLANGQNVAQVSKLETLEVNLDRTLLSNNRDLLSWAYAKIGIVQTIVDVPVDDAFRGGLEIQSKELDEADISDIIQEMEEQGDFEVAADTEKWTRLYGGGGTIINNGQDPESPLDINKMKKDGKLQFIDADMWELIPVSPTQGNNGFPDWDSDYYNFYGVIIHKSRILLRKGKRAPSYIRGMTRDYGLSALECLTRSLNQYLKTVDLTFEVLDEFKIDVFRIKNFSSSLMVEGGQEAILKRTQVANMEKNYNNALTMDVEDEYQQKQISFTGLAEVMAENRMQASADTKMPISKIFGVPSAGFSSGEDDIENYNGMIMSTIRPGAKKNLVSMAKLRCAQKNGFVPKDFKVSFKPLRVLSAVQEEEVKTAKFNRVSQARAQGDISSNEYREAINKDELLPIQLESGMGTDDLTPPNAGEGEGDAAPPKGKKSATQAKDAKEAKS